MTAGRGGANPLYPPHHPMVGFPAGREAGFAEMLAFIGITPSHLGAFAYSPEEGTTAVGNGRPVPEAVAEARLGRLMDKQRESPGALWARVGDLDGCWSEGRGGLALRPAGGRRRRVDGGFVSAMGSPPALPVRITAPRTRYEGELP